MPDTETAIPQYGLQTRFVSIAGGIGWITLGILFNPDCADMASGVANLWCVTDVLFIVLGAVLIAGGLRPGVLFG